MTTRLSKSHRYSPITHRTLYGAYNRYWRKRACHAYERERYALHPVPRHRTRVRLDKGAVWVASRTRAGGIAVHRIEGGKAVVMYDVPVSMPHAWMGAMYTAEEAMEHEGFERRPPATPERSAP